MLLAFLSFSAVCFAADAAVIHGTVTDPLGAIISKAKVDLVHNGLVVGSATTNGAGVYSLAVPAAGRYSVRVSADDFRDEIVPSRYIGARDDLRQDVTLSVGALAEEITVTATGTPTPQAQIGSAVTVLNSEQYAEHRDVQQALHLIPGVQLTQNGRPGGTTTLFIRGGNSNANKVLLDGVPVNDIGGFAEFGNISTTGVGRVEVLRGPNSTIYGADALAGVVNLTTQQGSTPLPQLTLAMDGGNFGAYHREAQLAGAFRQFDYFSEFARFDTANGIPGSQFHNVNYAGNVGWRLNPTTSLRATARQAATADGNPNQIGVFRIPDSALQREQDTIVSATLDNQTTERWHNLVRYGALRLNGNFTDFAPTGIPFYDAKGVLLGYAGAPVVLHGANGYTTSPGQAFYQFVQAYPNYYWTPSKRDLVYAQSDYRLTPHLVGLFGFKYEHERGDSLITGLGRSSVDRGNYSYTMALAGDVRNRIYYTLGSGVERNAIFGTEVTPRASLAYYLVRPGKSAWFSGTKLRGSFSRGIKEPGISEQNGSLYKLLTTQQIAQYHVFAIGAERSRSYDGGVDQELFDSRARASVTYFHNQFGDGIEYVPQIGLLSLGIPLAIAPIYGAFVNSQAFRAQGIESEIEYKVTRSLFARGGYTYLDAVVQRSFSNDAIGPSHNTSANFLLIPIGVYSPLKGARPFRRAPHSGYFGLYYTHSRWNASLAGTLVGRRDDSTFAYDKDGGTSLLLPNRNLDAAYQKLDLSGGYQATHLLKLYGSFENLLSQHYSEAFGYPSLPFTFRAGIQMTIGGESWKLK